MDFKLESQAEGEVDPPKVVNPDFKYLEVEVTRVEGTTLYLKVPWNFDVKTLRRSSGNKILIDACKETVGDYDWDDFGWEDTLEVQSVKSVEEKEATAYETFEVKPT